MRTHQLISQKVNELQWNWVMNMLIWDQNIRLENGKGIWSGVNLPYNICQCYKL